MLRALTLIVFCGAVGLALLSHGVETINAAQADRAAVLEEIAQ